MILLVKLILAHMAGDFLLQSNAWVKAKEDKKLKAYHLYTHALLHGVLIMLLVWDWGFLKWAAILAGSHLVIDAVKLLTQTEKQKPIFFFTDQALHLLAICTIYYWYQGFVIPFDVIINEREWFLITLIVFITFPTSIVIKMIIMNWSSQIDDIEKKSLKNAGKYIGILERLLVFTFVINSNWEAIGFLITAKSVFRFGDLTHEKDRKLTEYIMIGTLISFGIAILSGILYLKL